MLVGKNKIWGKWCDHPIYSYILGKTLLLNSSRSYEEKLRWYNNLLLDLNFLLQEYLIFKLLHLLERSMFLYLESYKLIYVLEGIRKV